MSARTLYVSQYGTWGTEQVELFDTTNWKSKDWDKLDEASDFDKLELAKRITNKRDRQATKRILDEVQGMTVRTFIIGDDGTIVEDNDKCPCGCNL